MASTPLTVRAGRPAAERANHVSDRSVGGGRSGPALPQMIATEETSGIKSGGTPVAAASAGEHAMTAAAAPGHLEDMRRHRRPGASIH